MSEAFETVLVKDQRLDCKSSVKYAVEKGGSNVTYSDIDAISASNTSHTYNVIVPSETTIIDRRVEWGATIQFRLNFVGVPPGDGPAGSATQPYDLVQYGFASALCAFPLHSCATVVSATINNNTISQNMDDVLQPMIRFGDRKRVHKYNGVTPTMPDNYLNYNDGLNGINNPLGSFNNAEKVSDYQARGSFQLLGINQTGYSTTTNDTVYRGTGGNVSLWVTARFVEPFMMSPFIFAHEKQNSQGFYGIQNLNFKMNMNPNARIWRQAQITNLYSPAPVNIPIPTVQIDDYLNSRLTFCYLTPHPEDLLPAKNVVGYLEMPRYITPGSMLIPAGTVSGQIQSQTLQLNQVPDKLIMFARRKNLTVAKSDSFLPITSIALNWNNASGLLATASQQKLWLMSVENGIQQSWLEWSGQAHNYNATVNGGVPVSPYPAMTVPLVGGILALDFAKDIQLTESYYAPGSLGTFQLQVRMTLFNQSTVDLAASEYEIVIITLNSGCFVCERGTSSTYTGILTKQDVLDASSKQPYFKSDVERCVGAGLMDNLKTVVGHALHKHGKHHGAGFTDESEGGAMSGGGPSGGGESGGKRHKMKDRLVR